MNSQALHGISDRHIAQWQRDVARVHGSLEQYAAATNTGYSADEIEQMALHKALPAAVPQRLQQIETHFSGETRLCSRLRKIGADYLKTRCEMNGHAGNEKLMREYYDKRRRAVEDVLFAQKLAGAWEIFRSSNPAQQLVGSQFLNNLRDHIDVHLQFEEHRTRLRRRATPSEMKTINRNMSELRHKLLDSHGNLTSEIQADMASIADDESSACHQAFLRIRTMLDETESFLSSTDRFFMPLKQHDALASIGAASCRLFEAYGMYLYNDLAQRLHMPKFKYANSAAASKNQTRELLLRGSETRIANKLMELQRKPSLNAWNDYSAEVESSIAMNFVHNRVAQLGSQAFRVDTTTRSFAQQMRIIHKEQNVENMRLRSERIARELSAMETSAAPKPKQTKSTKKGAAAKKRADVAPVPEEMEAMEVVPESIRNSIAHSLETTRESYRLEGQIAKDILENYSIFASVVGFNQKIARPDGSTLAEFDVHLDNAIVECTLKPAGKDKQIEKLVNDRFVNPFGKRVILYGPNQTQEAGRKLQSKHGAAVLIARNPEELGLMLFVNWSEQSRLQSGRQQAARLAN